MNINFLKKVNFIHLTGIAAIFLYPLYTIAEKTTNHDSFSLVLLNLTTLCILVGIFLTLWGILPLLMTLTYSIKGKSREDMPDSIVIICSILGLIFALWASRHFSEVYSAYQDANVKIIFGR